MKQYRNVGTKSMLRMLSVLGALCLWVPSRGYSVDPPNPFQICPRTNTSDTDEYALCATAECFVLNDVAYCKCDSMQTPSISASLEYCANPVPGAGVPPTSSAPPEVCRRQGGLVEDVCDLLNQGVGNGFTVSTYSTPQQLTQSYANGFKPGQPPPLAVYTCPGGSTGSYAQCDGGICFDSTTGKTFPGVGAVGSGQIVCSCPITTPRKTLPRHGTRGGFQTWGPWQMADGTPCTGNGSPEDCCNSDWFSRFCFPTPKKPTNGDIILVGAPPGTGELLSRLLADGTGMPPPDAVNSCNFEVAKGSKGTEGESRGAPRRR
jgi:hypothetical protein